MHPCLLVLHCSRFELQQRPAAGPATLTQQFLNSAVGCFPPYALLPTNLRGAVRHAW